MTFIEPLKLQFVRFCQLRKYLEQVSCCNYVSDFENLFICVMNLKIINEIINWYCDSLVKRERDDFDIWNEVERFQSYWYLESRNFKEMFSNSVNDKFLLWSRSDYFPIKSMQRYIDISDEVVRSIFSDLFNEKREIVGRIDRFMYQCDELQQVDKQNQYTIAPHYHQDQKAIFSYLCFRYPETYALYNADFFYGFMRKVGAKDLGRLPDINRFIKVSYVIKTLLAKHEKFIDLVSSDYLNIDINKFIMLHVSDIYWLARE